MMSRISFKGKDKTRDVIYGHSRQHNRNIPIVLSNKILQFYNETYHKNHLLQIKDILLPKLNFMETIVDNIEIFLLFKQCNTCHLVTWAANCGYFECFGYRYRCQATSKALQCIQCIDKLEWKCQFKYKSGNFCKRRYCKSCYCMNSSGSASTWHCNPCQCFKCNFIFCADHDIKFYFCILCRECFGCTKCTINEDKDRFLCNDCDKNW